MSAEQKSSYKASERNQYDPGPCPRCGGTDVLVAWHDVATYGNPDAWIPGLTTCNNPTCPSRPNQDPFS